MDKLEGVFIQCDNPPCRTLRADWCFEVPDNSEWIDMKELTDEIDKEIIQGIINAHEKYNS